MDSSQKTTSHNFLYIFWIILGFTFLGAGYLIWSQYQQIVFLHNQLILEQASTTEAILQLTTDKNVLTEKLNQTETILTETVDRLNAERDRNDDFEDQISQLAGTVGILDKVAKTDPELLQKYSKVYFLNENYIPANIKKISDKYILSNKGDQYFQGNALTFLTRMIDSAAKAGVDLKIISAYRSFETQSDLKGQYSQVYGTGANTFSADQGYSEHQLGTAVDLTDPTVAGTFLTFKDTEAYAWLQKNAYKYGFGLSYPEDNTFYIFEPWHWRFVGVDLATDLHRANASFYSWDQRKIDGYLVSLFD